jgi:hypothetical protein
LSEINFFRKEITLGFPDIAIKEIKVERIEAIK